MKGPGEREKKDTQIEMQGSPFITLCLGSIELDHVISEPYYDFNCSLIAAILPELF